MNSSRPAILGGERIGGRRCETENFRIIVLFSILGIDAPVPLPYNTVLSVQYTTAYRGVEQSVARRAHNPKVTGSSPVPATNCIVLWVGGRVVKGNRL